MSEKIEVVIGSIPKIEIEVRHLKEASVFEGEDVPVYDGAFEVAPKFEKQTLATKDKLLKNDVTVSEISVARFSNTSGGRTVIIGE